MICDQAIERLPWLLNGSLEPAELEEVQGHLTTCAACREALAETRKAWKIFGQHLPPEALVAMAYAETPEGIDSALAERHLASCPECAAELELARMSRRLEEDDRIATFPVKTSRETGKEYRAWRNTALAASLAGLVAFSGWFQAAQRARLVPEIQQKQAELSAGIQKVNENMARLTQPQINTPIPDLRPDEVTRGEVPEILIPANQVVTISLQPGHETTATERNIALLDEAGRTLWQSSGLRLDNTLREFTFTSGLLEPGRYTIQLSTVENGQPVPRERYSLRVQ
ncbi:MAG: zf-HC2 domain-containing protein [Thermoanaerobaculia bacterium]